MRYFGCGNEVASVRQDEPAILNLMSTPALGNPSPDICLPENIDYRRFGNDVCACKSSFVTSVY